MEPFSLVDPNHDPLFAATQSPPGWDFVQSMENVWMPLIDYWHPHVGTIPPEVASSLIGDYKALIETEIKKVLSRHSPSYWFLLGRYDQKFRWLVTQAHHNSVRGDLNVLVESINAFCETAYFKHGGNDVQEIVLTNGGTYPALVPVKPLAQEDLLGIRTVYLLSVAYDTAQECYLWANRGISIRVTTEPPLLWLATNKNQQQFLDVYQERHANWVAGSSFGSLVHWEATDNIPTDGLTLFQFMRVPDPLRPFAHRKTDQGVMARSPFRRGQIDPGPIWNLLRRFPGPFEQANGASPQSFFATFIALHRLALEQFKREQRYFHGAQFTGLAVLPSASDLVELLIPHAELSSEALGQGFPSRKTRESIARCVELLTWRSTKMTGVELPSATRHFPLLQTPDFVLLDLTRSRELLQDLLDSVRRFDGAKADAKGRLFEQEVEAKIRAEFPTAPFWERAKSNQPLRFPDGSDGEIDFAICRGNCLVVIEVKSEVIPAGYFQGEREAIRKRSDQLKKALKQVEAHCRKLSTHPVTDSYALPHEIEYLVPIICTAMPEWLDSWSLQDMLTPKTPRVCTPGELGRFLRERGPKYLSRLPFAIKVAR
jgi:hypothetical protein